MLNSRFGAVATPGSQEELLDGTYAIRGSGSAAASATRDAFHFVYQPINGAGSITAKLVTSDAITTQAGVAIRALEVGPRLRGAVKHRHVEFARRGGKTRAVADEVLCRGRFGERGQRRRCADHSVLYFLQHERGVRRVDEFNDVERHAAGR